MPLEEPPELIDVDGTAVVAIEGAKGPPDLGELLLHLLLDELDGLLAVAQARVLSPLLVVLP